ncbi:MAG: aminotransferase class I/II-fold pyridoxal phosphate-dependent enzyme [Phycisphaerales bacterium]|nr:MAG: aminotransferase class I/II-fold pyridoxal phosphate-dependent enzyme [Phycisphaerales bacterium]
MNTTKPVSLNLNIRGLGQSATLGIKDKCRRLIAEGRTVYDFGLGQSPFPVPARVVEALRLAATEKDYLPVKGLPALREAIADFHRQKDQIDAHPDRVIVGPGSKELMFLLQIVFYGEILIPTPCWVSYLPQAQIIGRRVGLLPTTFEDGWKMTPEHLERSVEGVGDDYRPRLLVLNYPSNPTGLSYTADELRELAEVARRFQMVVLSDEIYGQLHHEGQHVSLGQFYPEGTIISSGLSKWCGAGGWRLGTFVFPPDLDWLVDAMAAVASETYTSVSAPIQHAAVHAFRGGIAIERYLWHARRILRELGGRCAETLTQAGLRVLPPVGAFYLFLDFAPLAERLAERGIRNGAQLCDRLLSEAGVALLPGGAFAQSPGELTARLAYVNFDGARALAASENIPLDQELPSDFLERWCESTIHGAQRIAEWIDSD